MTARKLVQFRKSSGGGYDYRIVRICADYSVLERSDGTDFLGVMRWQCAALADKEKWRTLAVDGKPHEWVRGDYVRELLNALGDELNRLKLSPKRRRRSK